MLHALLLETLTQQFMTLHHLALLSMLFISRISSSLLDLKKE
jgi:hypothetical protein